MKKLNPGESGHIAIQWRTDDGRWIDAGRRKVGTFKARTRFCDHNGKTRVVSKTADTPERAQKALLEHIASLRAAHPSDMTLSTTVQEAAQRFIDHELPVSSYSDATREHYATCLGRYVTVDNPRLTVHLGSLTLEQANRPAVLRDFIMDVDRRIGPGAARTAKSAVRAVLEYACERGPLEMVAQPRRYRIRDEDRIDTRPPTLNSRRAPERQKERAMTAPELARFLKAAEQWSQQGQKVRGRPLVSRRMGFELLRFLAYTGARPSEALNLQWEDVSFDQSEVHIRGTKTARADRVLPMHKDLAKALKAHRGAVSAGYVFHAPAGTPETPWDPNNARPVWQKCLDDTGFAWATARTFRKTFITLADDAGVPERMIQDAVGHESFTTSQKHYLHRDRRASDALLNVFDLPTVSDEATPLRAMK